MRQLKYHEQKLLRKADFLQWKREAGHREVRVARRYHLQNPEDYHAYNQLVGHITSLATKLRGMDPFDPYRIDRTERLLQKLYDAGVIPYKGGLEQCAKVSVSAFCRRRLPVVLVRLKFAERVKDATAFVEGGHIRIGPEVVRDPAMLVTRAMEDSITWSEASKIRKRVRAYNDELDDYDML